MGIILARLLTPMEFGLIGMITVFVTISYSLVNSGFNQALIRKINCTEKDYSTVFYFNLIAGFAFYLILFFSAPLISIFFKEPQLTNLIKVLGIVLIIDSLTLIQGVKITKTINFRLLAKISVISNTAAGIIGITLAYNGYGVWSLVAKSISQRFLNGLFLWIWNRWRPIIVFSRTSFKELFAFGSKILISGFVANIYQNVFYVIIGKYFSAAQLGFYTRADQFKNLPAQNLNAMMARVTYPVMAQMQDDPVRLKTNYRKMIKTIMYISFMLIAIMTASAEAMIITLIGEQWRQSIIYLQLLSVVAVFFPVHSLNLNLLNVLGRSDLFLRMEIIKMLLSIPAIILGIIWGIEVMIIGLWGTTILSYYINSQTAGRMINYPFKEQMHDISSIIILALVMGSVVFLFGKIIPAKYLVIFISQVLIGLTITVVISELMKLEPYLYIKEIIKDKFNTFHFVRK